jgi:hypothetical protein
MAVRERLMFCVSIRVSPSAPESVTLSLPAKSTKCILPSLNSEFTELDGEFALDVASPAAALAVFTVELGLYDRLAWSVSGERGECVPVMCRADTTADPEGTLLSTCSVRMAWLL